MPTIDVAMARSIRPGVMELLKNAVARSIASNLAERDIITDAGNHADNVATAFSSWNNCMAAVYCKWPVIAVIIIGGLIIFSIVWCIIRCCCCGLSCCCSCCQCLKCCGDCCGCCDPPKGSRKHLDDAYNAPAAHHGYRTEPPMQAPAFGGVHDTPQFAEFEMDRKRDSNALPQMPSWENAGSKQVILEEEEVEMHSLNKSEQQSGIVHNTAAPPPIRPGPYGASSYSSQNAGRNPESYSPIDQQGYNYNTNSHPPSNNGYDQKANDYGYGMDQSYPAAGGAMGNGRNTPGHMDNGYGQSHNGQQHDYGYEQPASPGAQGYGMRHSPGPRRTPGPQGDYGYNRAPTMSPAPMRSPAPQSDYGGAYGRGPTRSPAPARSSPAPQSDAGYGQRMYPSAQDSGYGTRPVPQRQYGGVQQQQQAGQYHQPQPQHPYAADPPQSPITNNSGFDFNSGYARPQNSPTTESYPGYRAYTP